MFETSTNNKVNKKDEIGDSHIGTSAETPMRPDAFELSDEEKKNVLKKA